MHPLLPSPFLSSHTLPYPSFITYFLPVGMDASMDNEGVKAKVMEALRSRFRPEFLNRIDEFVTFNSLGMEQLVPIVSLELDKVATRLTDRKLTLSVTDSAKQWLGELGFDPSYGARPLKRTIQREVETPIAKAILGGKYPPGNTRSRYSLLLTHPINSSHLTTALHTLFI